jgi:hypothetical protein
VSGLEDEEAVPRVEDGEADPSTLIAEAVANALNRAMVPLVQHFTDALQAMERRVLSVTKKEEHQIGPEVTKTVHADVHRAGEWTSDESEGEGTDGEHDRAERERMRQEIALLRGELRALRNEAARGTKPADSSRDPPAPKAAGGGSSAVYTKTGSQQKETGGRDSEIKVPFYSGDAHVGAYLLQFELAAEANGWPREKWGVRLVTRLTGNAKTLLEAGLDPRRMSYDEMCAMLRRQFAGDAAPADYQAQLSSSTRADKETVHDLAARLLALAVRALPGLTLAQRKQTCTGYFLNALTDAQQRLHVTLQAPADVDAAVTAAVAYENAKRSEQARVAASTAKRVHAIESSDDKLDHLTRLVAALTTKLDASESNRGRTSQRDAGGSRQARDGSPVNQRGSGSRGSGKVRGKHGRFSNERRRGARPSADHPCRVCGGHDHWQRECPQRERSGRQSENGNGRGPSGQSHGPKPPV